MKNVRVILVFVVVCFVAFSCGQPTPPAGPPTAPTPKDDVQETATPVETLDDVGETETEEADVAEDAEEPVEDIEEPVEDAEEPAEDEAKDAGEPAVEGGTPKLVVPEPTYDFGTRQDSETVVHGFTLRNEGTGMLEIKNVRAACGCTAMELDKDKLAPGEEVEIGVSTNLRGRQGQRTFAVTVTTNDPDEPMTRLRMTGNVEPAIRVEPERINFGDVYDDTPLSETVNIKATVDDLTFKVNSAELSDMDFIEHEIEEVEPGRSYNIHVKTTGELPQGHHRSRMIIRTDARERSVIWLPINLQVVGALQIMPPTINIMHSDTPGEVAPLMQLRITAGRVDEFEIQEVIVPVDDIEAELIESSQNTYLLRLSNMPQSDILEDKAVILKTNIEGHEEVKIPFNVTKPRIRPQSGGQPARLSPEQIQQMRQRATAATETDEDADVDEE